jgi:hypothetical protein
MADERTILAGDEPKDILDSEEARENARRIEEQRRQIVEERWLSTHVLAMHLEIESMLGVMLRQTLPKPERFLEKEGMGPTFAQKLTLCDSLDLLEDNVVAAVRALNRLRNSYAHTPDQELSVPELVKFLAAVYSIHPFTYRQTRDGEEVIFQSYQELLAHFDTIGRSELESMLFISLRLLRAHLGVMFTGESNE